MSDLNIRNVDRSLLLQVKVAAVKANLTQRDFVIAALVRACEAGIPTTPVTRERDEVTKVSVERKIEDRLPRKTASDEEEFTDTCYEKDGYEQE